LPRSTGEAAGRFAASGGLGDRAVDGDPLQLQADDAV